LIYKAIIKYGYSSFGLDIIEYCDPLVLISREEYYLDNLDLAYNVLKCAGSLTGFKHSERSIKLMRESKLGRSRTEEEKLNIAKASIQAYPVIVLNNTTGEMMEFTSIRRASKFMQIHHSYIAKILKSYKIFKNTEYTVFLNNSLEGK
jgi:hypothetical protein